MSRLLGQCAALARLRLLVGHPREALAALFAPRDRLWSVRGWLADQSAPAVARSVAQRVASPQAVLILETRDADECLRARRRARSADLGCR